MWITLFKRELVYRYLVRWCMLEQHGHRIFRDRYQHYSDNGWIVCSFEYFRCYDHQLKHGIFHKAHYLQKWLFLSELVKTYAHGKWCLNPFWQTSGNVIHSNVIHHLTGRRLMHEHVFLLQILLTFSSLAFHPISETQLFQNLTLKNPKSRS